MDFYAEYCQYLQENAQNNPNLLEQSRAFNASGTPSDPQSNTLQLYDDFGVNRTEEFTGSLYRLESDKKSADAFENPKSMSPDSSESFGACKVCSDKATGIHYGVSTCEGCKV